MLSREQNPEVVDRYLADRDAGQVIGPLPESVQGVHVSRFGVIPKPRKVEADRRPLIPQGSKLAFCYRK